MENILPGLEQMHRYYVGGHTQSYAFRKAQLQKLKEALYQYEDEIYTALYNDLKKNPEECWVTELGFTIAEINYTLKHLAKWMKPRKVGTNLLNFPSKSYIIPEPLGVVLVISPWNYPLQLLLTPLVGAIAAGNCVVLKPSEFAPATAAIIRKIVEQAFNVNHVMVVEGDGAMIIPYMMDGTQFDHVFYTGSTHVGSLIYGMAAKQLVPVTLELGGKSPCIVERDANIKITARRIAITKFSNAGQMCVAPDYLLVHQTVLDALLAELKLAIEEFYNAEHTRGYHYGKIINEKQFNRLVSYMESGKIVYGGGYNKENSFIEPTLLLDVPVDAPVMQEEIFGPLLPIITWQEEEEVYQIINKHKNPLALYVFTASNEKGNKWIKSIAFGGGCINNASWHLTNHNLPFGGKGTSGIGNYHGKFSFETFSHKKGIMKTPAWFDPSVKYPPFKGKLKWFKKLIR